MEEYEIKFKQKGINIAAGVIWIIVAIVNLLILIYFFMLQPSFMTGTVIVTFELSIVFVLGLIIGIYYLRLSCRTYIKITEKQLQIHKGLVWGNETFNIKNIEEARLLGNKMFLIIVNSIKRKEIEIKLDLIFMKDLDMLLEKLSSNNIPVRRV